MKLIIKFIEKYGSDPLLHFGYAGWITSIGSFFGVPGTISAFFIMILLEIIKELNFDDNFDKSDFMWSVFGGLTSVLISLIFFVING